MSCGTKCSNYWSVSTNLLIIWLKSKYRDIYPTENLKVDRIIIIIKCVIVVIINNYWLSLVDVFAQNGTYFCWIEKQKSGTYWVNEMLSIGSNVNNWEGLLRMKEVLDSLVLAGSTLFGAEGLTGTWQCNLWRMLIPFCPLGWGKVFIRNKNTFTGEVQFSLVVCREGKSEVIRNMMMWFTKRQPGGI